MENTNNLEKRIQELEYRLGVLELFFDKWGLTDAYKGEDTDMAAIKIEVLRDMKNQKDNLLVTYDNEDVRNFYQKK